VHSPGRQKRERERCHEAQDNPNNPTQRPGDHDVRNSPPVCIDPANNERHQHPDATQAQNNANHPQAGLAILKHLDQYQNQKDKERQAYDGVQGNKDDTHCIDLLAESWIAPGASQQDTSGSSNGNHNPPDEEGMTTRLPGHLVNESLADLHPGYRPDKVG
jgi:hypothetical protein